MPRMNIDERRKQVITAAMTEFARRGFEGTATEAIAQRAGISQPYIFQLFPSKRALFLATIDRCFDITEQAMRQAAEGLTGNDAITAMSSRYRQLLADTILLQFQLQIYAAALNDPASRELARQRMAGLWNAVAEVSAEQPDRIQEFLARGMLLNVLTALNIPYQPEGELAASLSQWASSLPNSVGR
jgi:AcrR family transcriptional regulator